MITKELKEILKDFYKASSTLSTINRHIAFAGIGIVWILVKEVNEKLVIDNILLYAMLFFVGALVLDMLQYIYKSILLECVRRYYEKKFERHGFEKENVLEEFVEFKNYWNYPTWFFFITKVLLVGIGYYKLLFFILKNMH